MGDGRLGYKFGFVHGFIGSGYNILSRLPDRQSSLLVLEFLSVEVIV